MARSEAREVALEEALRDPASHFRSPRDVVDHEAWSRSQRRRVLEQWRLDAQQLETAVGENMSGGESSHLREVLEALSDLEKG